MRRYGRLALCACWIILLTRTGFSQVSRHPLPQEKQSASPQPGVNSVDRTQAEQTSWHSKRNAATSANQYKLLPVARVLGTGDYPSVRLTGFFQADSGWFHQSSANRRAVGDIQDGADFRRARLQAVGDVWDNVGYSIEFDFAFPGHPSFMDIWLEIRDVAEGADLRIGQYRQPIGMDALTSVKELTFIERALPFALIPFRQQGAMLNGTAEDDGATWALSMYRFPTDAFGGHIGDSGGYGVVGRVSALLVNDGNDTLVHVGGSYSFADPSIAAVRYRNQPEFFVAETGGAALVPVGVPTSVPAFADTGAIATDNFNLFGGELAARFGSLHLQSEVLVSVVNQTAGGTVVFPGAYVQAGYMLTGEVRPYIRKSGAFGRIAPQEPFSRRGGRGAWEIAARWSYLDLNEGAIRGSMLNDLTFGLNWYLNQYTKFQFNYIHAFLSSDVNGRSDADILALRAQLDF